MRTTNWTENKKYQAMREHKTQGGDECSFILRFLHRDEMFFVAGVSDADPVPVANAGEDQIVCEDTTVYLDGSGTTTTSSSAAATTTTTTTNSNNDNIKDTLAFSWTQSAGPAVDLKDAGTARPHFVFKANTPIQTPVDLEFELTVKDPRSNIESFPNSVVVTVVPRGHRKYGNNIAPDATVMASSQTAYTGQVARAAVDGVVDGLLRVSPTEFGSKTNEWVAEGERGSAWIKLEWDEQVNVAKVVLYDRVSCKNHVLGGVLSFSDGSTVDVGELNNIGGPTVVEFEPKNVIGMMFTINAVSNTTVEDGLAEIMVYGLDEENYGVYCSVKNNVNDVNNNNFNNVANENEADEEADEEEDEKDEMGKQETEEEKDMKIQLKMEKEREELMEEFGEATAEAPEVQERDDNKVHVKDANAPQTRFAHEGVEARKENKVININGKEKDEEEEEEEEDEDVQMEKNKDKSDKNIEKTEKVNKEKVSEDEEKEVIITDGGKIDTKRYPVNTNYVKRQSTKAALASMNKRKARIMFLNGVFVFFALVVFIVTTVKFNLANKATMCFTHRAF